MAASKSDSGLGNLVFLFFRDLTVVKSEYINVEESPVVGLPDIRFGSIPISWLSLHTIGLLSKQYAMFEPMTNRFIKCPHREPEKL